MNEFKGTQGEWKSTQTEWHTIYCEDEEIAELNNSMPLSELDANAQLIAAAPELLEALQATLKALEIANLYLKDNNVQEVGTLSSIPLANKAINKALNKNSD